MDYNSPYAWIRQHQAPFVNRILCISDLFVKVFFSLHPPASGIYRRKTLQIYNFKMRLVGGRTYAWAICSANLVVLTHNGGLNVNGTNAIVWPYPPPDKGKTERESFVGGRMRLHVGYNERETNIWLCCSASNHKLINSWVLRVMFRTIELTSTWVSGRTDDKDSWSFVICLTALRMAWDGIGALTSHW